MVANTSAEEKTRAVRLQMPSPSGKGPEATTISCRVLLTIAFNRRYPTEQRAARGLWSREDCHQVFAVLQREFLWRSKKKPEPKSENIGAHRDGVMQYVWTGIGFARDSRDERSARLNEQAM